MQDEMKIGFIGPASRHDPRLRRAAEFLLMGAEVEQAIYLGVDTVIDDVVQTWSRDVMSLGQDEEQDPEEAFLDRAARLAASGGPDDIDALIEADARVERLASIRRLPPPPSRAVEMVEDRIVLVVYDKAVLDEEDIANAHVIVYGKSEQPLIRKFGPRYFFTPGPLERDRVGMIEQEDEGVIVASLFDTAGACIARETLQTRAAKLTVTR
jgi:hypothetical protein